jgi:hypothetical protein
MAAAKDSDGPKVREAEALLRECLPCSVPELRRLASERDIGWRSLQRAKVRLGVITTQAAQRHYAWSFNGTAPASLVLTPAELDRRSLGVELATLSRGQLLDRLAAARLKNDWALAPLRVRGLDRVKLHADLTILTKLSGALARARGIALAA